MEEERLQTGVSQAFWCMLTETGAQFQPAKFAIGEEEMGTISWFDILFERGILLPHAKGKPLTFLIKGPPGSGKTTLALELCYRLAKNSLFSLYVSTDAETNRLIENASKLGWQDIKDRILTFEGRRPDVNAVAIWGREKIKGDTLSDIVANAHHELLKWIVGERAVEKFGERVELPKVVFERDRGMEDDNQIRRIAPDILVIDSLNVVEPEERGKFFERFLEVASDRTKMVIFILDSSGTGQEHGFWEYVSDIVVQLDYTYLQDYYIRTIEIVKARYQSHIWGKHQLKIYAGSELGEAPIRGRDESPENYERRLHNYNIKLRRAHPYRKEGGIFIFPSIHYYLSAYKRRRMIEGIEPVETCPVELNKVVQLPKGRCTAFIGHRGGHKSHLGYLHVLNRLSEEGNREGALIISLRDDEGMTKSTMENILKTDRQFAGSGRSIKIDSLEKENRLEILYYPPGYITPEEFFHRMLMSIHRLKQSCTELTVLFNSLDQLSARFPLCAKQEIFVPGIIEMLAGERVTSIFIAVDEPGQPAEQYGLLPMADLILSFRRRRFNFNDYYNHLNEARYLDGQTGEFGEKIKRIKEKFYISTPIGGEQAHREAIVLQVVRFWGGQKAGAMGLLELVGKADLDNELYEEPGLYFTELSPKYHQGVPIEEPGSLQL